MLSKEICVGYETRICNTCRDEAGLLRHSGLLCAALCALRRAPPAALLSTEQLVTVIAALVLLLLLLLVRLEEAEEAEELSLRWGISTP